MGITGSGSTSEQIDYGDVTAARFERAKAWTMLCFIKPADLTTDQTHLFGKWNASPQRQFRLRISNGGSGSSRLEYLRINNSPTAGLGDYTAITEGLWYLAAFSCDGTETASDANMWLCGMDGTIHEDKAFTLAADDSTLTAPIECGHANGSDPYDGEKAFLCYVEKDITSQELKAFSRNPWRQLRNWKAQSISVVLFSDLKAVHSGVAEDFSGNGNTATISGSPAIGPQPPVRMGPGTKGMDPSAIPAGGGGVDTERKRRSVAAAGRRWRGPSIVPDGSISQGDRYAIARNYWRETEVAGQPGKGIGEAVAAARGFVVRGGLAKAIAEAVATGQGTAVRISPASGVGEAKTTGQGAAARLSRASGRGEARSSAFGTIVHWGRASAAAEARGSLPGGSVLRAGRASGVGSASSSGQPTGIRAGRASAVGDAQGKGVQTPQVLSEARGAGEASAAGFGVPLRAGRGSGAPRAAGVAFGARIGAGRASGGGEGRTAATGTVVVPSRASAVAASQSSAIPTIVHRGRVVAVGTAAGSAQPTAIRAGRASGIGETLGRGEQAPTLVGRATGIGVSRTSARSTVVRAGRASAVGETKTSPFHDRFAQVKTIGESRASAKGTVVRAGRASAVGASSTQAFLVRAFWIYDLIRGETRYEMQSTYLPREVDTHVRIERRSRKTPGDMRSAAIGPRAWPPICAQLWIKTPGTERWNPLDLTGVDEVRFRMIDRHANAVILDRLANVVGDPTDGRVEYPWDPGDVDVPGDYLGRWRVDFESHHEKPLFVPLREEHDVLVTT